MEIRKKILLYTIIFDIVGFSFAWVFAYIARYLLNPIFQKPINPFLQYITILPLILIIWMLILKMLSFYSSFDFDTRSILERNMKIFKAVLMGMLITMSFSFMTKEYDFGRSVVLLFTVLNFIFLILSRNMIIKKVKAWDKKGLLIKRSIILGINEYGIRILQKLEDMPALGYIVLGFVDDEIVAGNIVCNRPVLGKMEDLKKIIKDNNIKHVFAANAAFNNEYLFNIVEEFEGKDVTFNILTSIFEMLKNNKNVHMIGDLPIITIRQQITDYQVYDATKRIFDVCASFIGLVLAIPIAITAIICIKADTKGKAIITQERAGLNGKLFKMYKFRSMRTNTDLYEKAPDSDSDDRITKVGKFIRKYSIDELPQLFNVLIGDMSIIGPRPEMPFLVEKYLPWQRKRLTIKPGLTGLWQVLGRKDIPLDANLEYDFYYIKNRSFALDLSILLKTIPVLIMRKGAY
ncbi:MAG: sugar transferase [Pseudomonadota bacterium]